MNKRFNPKRVALCGMLLSLMLILGWVEHMVPLNAAIPGIKLGLSNIITVYAVYAIGAKEGAMILAARIFLGAVFSGNFGTIFYSAGGGLLAILTTIGRKYVLKENQLWIAGCLGAIAHSIGQMTVAVLLTAVTQMQATQMLTSQTLTNHINQTLNRAVGYDSPVLRG